MSDVTPRPRARKPLTTHRAPRVHGAISAESCGQTVLHPTGEQYLGVMKALLDDGYTLCVDLTGVDYLAFPGRSLPDGVEPGASRWS